MDVSNLSAFRNPIRARRAPAEPLGDRAAQVVAIAAQKGGVGKTTTAVHLASGMARFCQRRTLLIDLDPQCHVGMSLRRSGPLPSDTPLGATLLSKESSLQRIVTKTSLEELFVVPSDPGLNETEQLMASRIGKEILLKRALKVARTHFDLIVLDCPPNLGALTVNALVAADNVLIPCDLSLLSLDGVAAMLETVLTVQETLNPSLEVLGLLKTRIDRRNQTVNAAIEKVLEARYEGLVLGAEIGVSTDVTKAQLAGESVFDFSPKGRASASYRALAEELDNALFGQAQLAQHAA